jgi:hypothetical protein
MRERPMLFGGEMVRALLDGRKTQTRRPADVTDQGCKPGFLTPKCGWVPRRVENHLFSYAPWGVKDRLWVRETWRCHELDTGLDGVLYRADGAFRSIENTLEASEAWVWANRHNDAWRPSLHMPRWASRITLEVTAVLVERLQDITESDAIAEGMRATPEDCGVCLAGLCSAHQPAVGQFANLWDSLYAKKGLGWDSNPWVWKLTFRVMKGTE